MKTHRLWTYSTKMMLYLIQREMGYWIGHDISYHIMLTYFSTRRVSHTIFRQFYFWVFKYTPWLFGNAQGKLSSCLNIQFYDFRGKTLFNARRKINFRQFVSKLSTISRIKVRGSKINEEIKTIKRQIHHGPSGI